MVRVVCALYKELPLVPQAGWVGAHRCCNQNVVCFWVRSSVLARDNPPAIVRVVSRPRIERLHGHIYVCPEILQRGREVIRSSRSILDSHFRVKDRYDVVRADGAMGIRRRSICSVII